MNAIIDVILDGETYRGLQIPDEVTASTGDPVADFSCVLQALVAGGMKVSMPLDHGEATTRRQKTEGDESPPLHASALADRVECWLSQAITRAKITPSPESDGFFATLPPFRRFLASGLSESAALDGLRVIVCEWAWAEIAAGRELPTWETRIPEVTEAMKGLVRLSNLRRELHTRAAQWGGKRQNLPAGAVERCLVDIDAVVTRYAMQIQGVPPPACQS